MKVKIDAKENFEERHHGKSEKELTNMLSVVGVKNVEELIQQTIPPHILLKKELQLTDSMSETDFLKHIQKKSNENKVFKSYIGLGYYETITPSVILRNILENPGWYTAYTPYQAEISQGRMEALINYQTMVCDLTGMELANASLLDEGTAAAEAMALLFDCKNKEKGNTFFVDNTLFPQTIEVLKTRAEPLGIHLIIDQVKKIDANDKNIFGILIGYPNGEGEVICYEETIKQLKNQQIKIAFCTDLLALTILKPPGEYGADVVVGSSQRFGVSMGFGGPHAAFFATKEAYKRSIPGRIIGVSLDKEGNKTYRMALQTREQHIRREKATSNICTAQVLLAVIASMYAVYHGPDGLQKIAYKILALTQALHNALKSLGISQKNEHFFDTLKLHIEPDIQAKIKKKAEENAINFRYTDPYLFIALNETDTIENIQKIIDIFASVYTQKTETIPQEVDIHIPQKFIRSSTFLNHTIFHTHRTEHEMLRYIKYLENKDISMVHSMISLGSCTMKLNATTEMIPLTWEGFANIHPFAPQEQTKGYLSLIQELSHSIKEITGFTGVSFQPNSGAQGEYAGLMVIRAYHLSKGNPHRNIALIGASAHGTNPASASMAGLKIVIVPCDEKGNIDIQDLKIKVEQHKDQLNCLMITYPSTHGVFEDSITEVCDIIHNAGGQVYMDGANMNAQVGLTSPASIGADVCHLNLHKTFCIPHGGGGPGMGPIAVAAHLTPFLPEHIFTPQVSMQGIGAVSSAPFGSASILTISYAYISLMGKKGITKATQYAILNANYIKERLKDHYKILYTNKNGRCAHEMILDCREFKAIGIEVEDIAKRLMDYGYHAPTVAFPVPGTLMIEPTESESQKELDTFCNALISIRTEIQEIKETKMPQENNVLKNAPHTFRTVTSEEWNLPYSREKAAFPLPYLRYNKIWATVSRIDNGYGDRNLFCSCIPIPQ